MDLPRLEHEGSTGLRAHRRPAFVRMVSLPSDPRRHREISREQRMSDREHIKTNWYEDFFRGVANDLWRKAISPEQTRVEADFLENTFGAKSRLLDVPCGNGRHTLELARRGCRMTG